VGEAAMRKMLSEIAAKNIRVHLRKRTLSIPKTKKDLTGGGSKRYHI